MVLLRGLLVWSCPVTSFCFVMFWSCSVTSVSFGKKWVETFGPDVFTHTLLTEGVFLHRFTLDELFLACLTGEVEPFFSAVGACPWPLGKQNICKSCVHGGLLNVGWALSLFPTDFHFVTLSWGLSQMQVKFQGLGTSYLGIILFCSWFWNQVTMDFAFLLIERKGRVKRKPT